MEHPCQVMTNTVVVRGFGEQKRLTAEYAVGALDSVVCRTYVGLSEKRLPAVPVDHHDFP